MSHASSVFIFCFCLVVLVTSPVWMPLAAVWCTLRGETPADLNAQANAMSKLEG